MNQKTVTIPVNEYRYLQDVARRFEQAKAVIVGKNDLVFVEPPVKDVKNIIAEMKKTKKYSAAFLKSMKQGLEESKAFAL